MLWIKMEFILVFTRILTNRHYSSWYMRLQGITKSELRKKGFHNYLNKVHKINSEYKVILYQWSQGVFFALYACNTSPVDGTDIP